MVIVIGNSAGTKYYDIIYYHGDGFKNKLRYYILQQCKLLISFRTGNGVVVTRYRRFIIVIYYRSAQDRIRSFEHTDEMCSVVNTSLLYYCMDSLTVETAKRVMFCGSCGRHSIQLYTSTNRNSLKLYFI